MLFPSWAFSLQYSFKAKQYQRFISKLQDLTLQLRKPYQYFQYLFLLLLLSCILALCKITLIEVRSSNILKTIILEEAHKEVTKDWSNHKHNEQMYKFFLLWKFYPLNLVDFWAYLLSMVWHFTTCSRLLTLLQCKDQLLFQRDYFLKFCLWIKCYWKYSNMPSEYVCQGYHKKGSSLLIF